MKDHFKNAAPKGNNPKALAQLFSKLNEKNLNSYTLDYSLHRKLRTIDPSYYTSISPLLNNIGQWLPTLDAQAAYSDRENPPRLETVKECKDAKIQRAVVNSQYEACHQQTYKHGLISAVYDRQNTTARQLDAFIGQYLYAQADISIACPYCMTHGVVEGLTSILNKYEFEPDKKILIEKYRAELLRTDGKTMTGGTWATEKHSGLSLNNIRSRKR